MVMKGQYKVKS